MGAFQKATKKQARLRMAVSGPSGAGKTYTSLRIAKGLGGRVAVIDSERGSASKYADEFSFDVLELQSFHPQRYVEAIKAAEAEGYDVLIIDSLSHAWAGKDGALEQVDRAGDRNKGNKFAGWKDVTPMQNALVDAMLQSRCHVIATMRSKSEWVIEEDSRGKKVPRKIGMAPVQRDQIEYEFDVFGELADAKLLITKTRCKHLRDASIIEPGEELAASLKAWLTDGAPMVEPKPTLAAVPGPALRPVPRLRQWAAACGIPDAAWGKKLREVIAPRTKPEEVTDADVERVIAHFAPEEPPEDMELPLGPPPPSDADAPQEVGQ